MRSRHYGSLDALGVKVDYVDLKHDENIKNLKEGLRETIDKLEAGLKADREAAEARLKADREAAEARLKADREASEARLAREVKESEARLAEERKDSRATRRALNANFIAVIVLIFTIIGLFIATVNGTVAF